MSRRQEPHAFRGECFSKPHHVRSGAVFDATDGFASGEHDRKVRILDQLPDRIIEIVIRRLADKHEDDRTEKAVMDKLFGEAVLREVVARGDEVEIVVRENAPRIEAFEFLEYVA